MTYYQKILIIVIIHYNIIQLKNTDRKIDNERVQLEMLCYIICIYNKDTSDITLYNVRLLTLLKQFSSNFKRYIFFSITMLQTAWFWLGVTNQ